MDALGSFKDWGTKLLNPMGFVDGLRKVKALMPAQREGLMVLSRHPGIPPRGQYRYDYISKIHIGD